MAAVLPDRLEAQGRLERPLGQRGQEPELEHREQHHRDADAGRQGRDETDWPNAHMKNAISTAAAT